MSLLEAAIGWLAPPQCVSCGVEGSTVCGACASTKLIPYGQRCFGCGTLTELGRTCSRCRRFGSPARVWVTTNHEGAARDLLHAFKFEQQRAAADSLALLMAATFVENNGADYPDYLVIPVPTATKRVRQRGFDHAQLLARSVARKLGLNYQPVLARLGQTRQVGSKRADRIAQMADKYLVKNSARVSGQKILLIDDVVTTGATLNTAARALRLAGATRVDALVFARRL